MSVLSGIAGTVAGVIGEGRVDPHPRDSLWDAGEVPRFASVLPYELFDSSGELYSLANPAGQQDAIGFSIEALCQVGVNAQLENAIQNLPGLLPEGAGLQVAMFACASVDSKLARYARLRPDCSGRGRAEGVFRRLVRRRYDCFSGLDGELRPRDYRLVLSVTLPGQLESDAAARLRFVRQGLEALMNSCGMPCWTLAPGELIGLLAPFLNPESPGRRAYEYDPSQLISDQIVLRDTRLEVASSSLNVSGDGRPHALSVLAATAYPPAMSLAGMGGLLGDPLRSQLGYRGPFAIVMCCRILSDESARSMAAIRSARANSNAGSPMARLAPSYYRRQMEDWQLANEVIASGGGLAHLAHYVLLAAPAGLMASAIESARSIWRTRGFTLASCEFMQTQGLLATLPMTLTREFADDLRRSGWMSRKTTYNIAHSLPVIGEWKGTRTPAMMMIARRGQLVQLDLFDSPGNYNAVVAGASGTGKSVLLNEIACAYLGLGAQVWIIDVGGSYQKLCDLLGGQLIRFQRSSDICLNPFTLVSDIEDDMHQLRPLFAQMIGPQGLGDYQLARLEEAIVRTWEMHGNDSRPSHLRQRLQEGARLHSDARLSEMAAMLGAYCRGGSHGRWFDGAANVSFSSDLCLLELEELKAMPELQAVVLMQLMFLINQQMYSSRDRRKLVIIDEAWQMLRGEHTTEFIENGFRRARKYNGAFLTATQSVADFFSSSAARAAYANSDWMLLLAQKSEEIARLRADGQLLLGAGEQELLQSLATEPGRFAEILVRCEGLGAGVCRLVIDPFARLLFSSRAGDHQAIEEKRSSGLAIADAVDAVLAERGQ